MALNKKGPGNAQGASPAYLQRMKTIREKIDDIVAQELGTAAIGNELQTMAQLQQLRQRIRSRVNQIAEFTSA